MMDVSCRAADKRALTLSALRQSTLGCHQLRDDLPPPIMDEVCIPENKRLVKVNMKLPAREVREVCVDVVDVRELFSRTKAATEATGATHTCTHQHVTP